MEGLGKPKVRLGEGLKVLGESKVRLGKVLQGLGKSLGGLSKPKEATYCVSARVAAAHLGHFTNQ
jgi:hypothetical protein